MTEFLHISLSASFDSLADTLMQLKCFGQNATHAPISRTQFVVVVVIVVCECGLWPL